MEGPIPIAQGILGHLLGHTIYGEVMNAMNDSACAKPLVKRLSDQRRMALVVFGAVLAFYVHNERMTAAANVLILVLLCSHISSVYDGINDDTFKAYVKSIGPAAFTVINVLPSVISQVLLSVELVNAYQSKLAAVVIILVVALPGFVQAIAGSAFRRGQAAPAEA